MRRPLPDRDAGIRRFAVLPAGDRHPEQVIARVHDPGKRGRQQIDVAVQRPNLAARVHADADQVGLVALPGPLQALQPRHVVVRDGLLHQKRVPRRQRLRLRGAEGNIADILDLTHVEPTAHDLRDELRLPLHDLPHIAVETALDDVPVQPDLGVLVALPHDASVTLFDIGRPPRAIHMVQRNRARLHVRPDAHLRRRPDQNRDMASRRGREQPRLVGVGFRFVNITDGLSRHPTIDQLQTQLVIRIPPVGFRRAQVTEHQLQRARRRRRLPEF